MPYIPQDRREAVLGGDIQNVGDLNYYVTMQCIEFVKENGESYKTYLDLFACLECLKMGLAEHVEYTSPPLEKAWSALKKWADNPGNLAKSIATITMVQHEIYRRRIQIYEDKKISENGDVYE